MAFKFPWTRARKKRKQYKRRRKPVSKSQPYKTSQVSQELEIKPSQSLDTVDTNQILARLDVMTGFLREHHNVIKNQIQETHTDLKEQLLSLGMAKRIVKETSLDKIVQEKLSQGEKRSQIVRLLVETGACSRATAYRVLGRNETSQLSQVSQLLSQ
jgi:hypothetical protein